MNRISIRIHNLVSDGLQPVRAHERLEPTLARVESEALEIGANAVVAGEPRRRQELGHDRLPEIPTRQLAHGRDLEVEEVEEGKSAGSAPGPVDDARQDSVLGEHVAVPEVAVAEAAGQVSRLGRERVGQLPHLVRAARVAEPGHDLRVLLDVKAGAAVPSSAWSSTRKSMQSRSSEGVSVGSARSPGSACSTDQTARPVRPEASVHGTRAAIVSGGFACARSRRVSTCSSIRRAAGPQATRKTARSVLAMMTPDAPSTYPLSSSLAPIADSAAATTSSRIVRALIVSCHDHRVEREAVGELAAVRVAGGERDPALPVEDVDGAGTPGHEPAANGGRLAAQPGRSREPLPAAHESSAVDGLAAPDLHDRAGSVSDEPRSSPDLDVGALVDDLPARLGDRNGQLGALDPKSSRPGWNDGRKPAVTRMRTYRLHGSCVLR